MTRPQHTPGPWEVWPGTYYGYDKVDVSTVYAVERVHTENGLGATYVTIVAPRSDKENFQVQQSANARLIAAAPELLGALIAMMTLFGMDENDTPINRLTFQQGRDAVAKAAGLAA